MRKHDIRRKAARHLKKYRRIDLMQYFLPTGNIVGVQILNREYPKKCSQTD